MNDYKGYWNPILAGIILGIALFGSFMIAGQGMGASGAFARATAQLTFLYDGTFDINAYASKYLSNGDALANWTVIQVVGIFLGGYISAAIAGRIKSGVDRGEGYPIYKRLFWAFLGGIIIAVATRFARGCTSGQALDGAATFSVGAWIFMLAAFGAGFLFSALFKKQWKGVN
ncbi:MAG: YeeE/YedE thiosulfate transporter family protein [Campylobacterota bacterium]|nr:YeeE/YedE thiosulfate transporter family protein [Campylobacterota bacterium]